MADTVSSEQNPFEAWSKLLESTMQSHPATSTTTGHTGKGGGDPWMALIDQLWQANPYSSLVPLDPAEITRAFQQIWMDAARNPGQAWSTYSDFVQQYTQVMASTALQFWGRSQEGKPVIAPEPGDKRFSASDWQQNPV